MRVSVIVVNYKTPDLTIQAVKTLRHYCPWLDQDGEILVVDNGSGDDSPQKIQQALQNITFIQNDENKGFTGGNNPAMKIAKGDYVILLNSDTVSIEDPITPILDWMDQHKNVGISSIKLLYEDRSTQENGGYFPTIWTVFLWMSFLEDLPYVSDVTKTFHPQASHFYKQKTFYNKERNLDWVTGAFFVICREVMEKIGYLDEDLFMYGEDYQYCYRAKLAGYSTKYVPIAKIVHLMGKSSTTKRFPVVSEYKNMRKFFATYHGKFATLIVRLLLKKGAVARMVLFGLMRKQEAVSIYVEAFRVA